SESKLTPEQAKEFREQIAASWLHLAQGKYSDKQYGKASGILKEIVAQNPADESALKLSKEVKAKLDELQSLREQAQTAQKEKQWENVLKAAAKLADFPEAADDVKPFVSAAISLATSSCSDQLQQAKKADADQAGELFVAAF